MPENIIDELFRELDKDDLNPDELFILQLYDKDTLKKLSLEGGGVSYFIKRPLGYKRTLKKIIKRKLEQEVTVKELARQLQVTERHIRNLAEE